jgi:N-acetyl-beta-hexosaminidase
VVDATEANIANERLAQVVKLINAELVEKEISANPHAMVYATAATAADIFVKLVPVADITSETSSEEAYKITINESGVLVEAASENAAMYALRTIQAMMITNNGLVYGTIVDYPDVAERRLHVDAGRKYFSKDWFIREIREMSYLKMNAIQIHFAENLGFRIECETDPQIVSADHLKKSEVREILAEAEKYGVKVIPSLDTPGHVQHILQFHPEYGQVDTSGNHSTTALDITNPEAVAYIYSLYDEYMELFRDKRITTASLYDWFNCNHWLYLTW